jgi:hypothetical protein
LKTGKAAVPQLIDALKTAEGRKAEAIAQILGSIGGRETLYPLLRLADDPNQVLRVRLAATMSAAKQGDQSQWPLLIAGLWLSGEWLLLSDALSGSKLVNNELDRHRLQWYREAQQETFSAVRSALHSLAPNASPAFVPEEKIWETVIAWNKWWTKGRPFQAVEVLADDPWQNRFWCKRTLGTLAEYGPMVAEMRRLFIEARLSHYGERQNIPFARAVAELESMNYSVEPFAQGSKESVRFSLSGYVQSNMITYDYGYDRKTGAWVLLGRTFIGYDGLPQTKGKEQQK